MDEKDLNSADGGEEERDVVEQNEDQRQQGAGEDSEELRAVGAGNASPGMKFARWALLLVSIIGLVGSLGYIVYTPTPSAPLPAFATLVAEDLNGDAKSFEDFAGDILIVDFWATWCAPCITEIPHYNELHADYGDRGVTLVGLTFQSGTGEEVLEWMASDPKYVMDYPLVMSNDELMEAFGPVFGFPTTVLIDRDGTVVKRWIGAAPNKSAQIRELLDEMLAGGDVSEDHEGHIH